MLELKDTIDLMNSADFKERFVAEYAQTKIRYNKLHAMLVKYKARTLSFTPNCSYELLAAQAEYMEQYLRCLEVRAEIEGVKLPENELVFHKAGKMSDETEAKYYKVAKAITSAGNTLAINTERFNSEVEAATTKEEIEAVTF